jgi:NADH:ubiquinone oxidoreductase subunit
MNRSFFKDRSGQLGYKNVQYRGQNGHYTGQYSQKVVVFIHDSRAVKGFNISLKIILDSSPL